MFGDPPSARSAHAAPPGDEAARQCARAGERVVLSWEHKEWRLVLDAHGGYERVPTDDVRVREVKWLRPRRAVGGESENLLIAGDALDALRSLTGLPEYAQLLVGRVKLIYIDPPFNTGKTFAQYEDHLEHVTWLTMMRDCLDECRRLLSPDGSIWVHLDDAQMAYGRMLMDEVFGRENFIATIAWQKADSVRMDARRLSASCDYIMAYARSSRWVPHRDPSRAHASRYLGVEKDGRRYATTLLRKTGSNSHREDRPTLWYPLTAPDGTQVWPVRTDGAEGCWRWSRRKYDEEHERVTWEDKGHGPQPYVKSYLDESAGTPPPTLWLSEDVGHNREAKAHLKQLFRARPFATPKPERLLARIVHIASDPGDIILDCCAGSGTTAAVAHKMGRRWVAIERETRTIEEFIVPRLSAVIKGEDSGGDHSAHQVEGRRRFPSARGGPFRAWERRHEHSPCHLGNPGPAGHAGCQPTRLCLRPGGGVLRPAGTRAPGCR